MRKCTATVLYKDNRIYHLCVNYKGSCLSLIRYTEKNPDPFHYNNFQNVFKAVLNTLKNNNFYVSKYKDFNSFWYDINWIDLNEPLKGPQKYSYSV